MGAAAAGDFAKARQVLMEADTQRPDYPLPWAIQVKVGLNSGALDAVEAFLRMGCHRFPP